MNSTEAASEFPSEQISASGTAKVKLATLKVLNALSWVPVGAIFARLRQGFGSVTMDSEATIENGDCKPTRARAPHRQFVPFGIPRPAWWATPCSRPALRFAAADGCVDHSLKMGGTDANGTTIRERCAVAQCTSPASERQESGPVPVPVPPDSGQWVSRQRAREGERGPIEQQSPTQQLFVVRSREHDQDGQQKETC
ncbi:hypothetical protein BJX63DRAFT_435744 [Aspergillus granulosus]|uniref:Uncharacterized protein n=1 Tax=Aspergillus granulosus TaxID=176169 RepID=A0ABR4H0C0_9EURO